MARSTVAQFDFGQLLPVSCADHLCSNFVRNHTEAHFGPPSLDHSSLATIFWSTLPWTTLLGHHFLEHHSLDHPSLDHPSLNHPSVCRLSWPLLLPWLHLALGSPTMDLRRTAQIFVFFRFPHSKFRLSLLSSLLVSQGRTQIIIEVIFIFQNPQMKVCFFKENGARGGGGKAASPNRGRVWWKQHHSVDEEEGSTTSKERGEKSSTTPKRRGGKYRHPQGKRKGKQHLPAAPPSKKEGSNSTSQRRRRKASPPTRGDAALPSSFGWCCRSPSKVK